MYHFVFLSFLFVSMFLRTFAAKLGAQHFESAAAGVNTNTAVIQQYLSGSGIGLSSYLSQESVNKNVLSAALVACIPELLLPSSISSIVASASLVNSSIEVITTLISSDSLATSYTTRFTDAILSGQYNNYLQTFANEYGSSSLLNATCTIAVISYGTQSPSNDNSASSNVGLAVGLTIFSIFTVCVCFCVGIWYYRKISAEIEEEKRLGQQFNLTELGQSSNAKNDGYTRTFSRQSTLQNMDEAEISHPDAVVENTRHLIWMTPFHDCTDHGDDTDVGPIEQL